MIRKILVHCLAVAVLSLSTTTISAEPKIATVDAVAAKIDGFLESHWSANKVKPAKLADDAEFLRRISLDLLGRIPTTGELDQLLKDKSADKRKKLIERLINSPEFPLHFGSVLDRMIQTRYAGNTAFVDYLRRSVRDAKPWDAVFRELMLGPWDTEQSKPANRFLDKRAKNVDVLTVDATRVFFGVDISCAKCHDHPLVEDWTQDHFYGMASFFHRTTGGRGKVGEKNAGEVKFLAADGKEKTAKLMFLSGQVLEEPAAVDSKPDKKKTQQVSRREQLVKISLNDKVFFSRSIVNRMWDYFFGRGLVMPVDQMHSGNESAVPGLLEWLAEDFAAGGYDLRRLISAIVSSRAYQLSSRWEQDAPLPEASLFAAASLRPLSRRQLANSLIVATGNANFNNPSEIDSRVARYSGVNGLRRIEQYLAMEQHAAELVGSIDQRRADFQSSVGEALFMSNNTNSQKLLAPEGENLAARLSKIEDNDNLIDVAIRQILNRPASDEERKRLAEWLARQGDDRLKVSQQLIWALVASAEFRFNH